MSLLFCIFSAMQLIVITPDNEVREEIGIVNGLFAQWAAATVHLRKPSFTTADYRNYINELPAKYHSRIVVHGGFELVDEFKLGGIHLNSSMVRDDKGHMKNNDRTVAIFFIYVFPYVAGDQGK